MLHLHYVKESGKTSQRPKRRVTSFADGICNLDACLKTLHWWAVWYAKILKNINKDLCRQAGWETMVFKCCLKATIGWRKLTNDMIEYCEYHSMYIDVKMWENYPHGTRDGVVQPLVVLGVDFGVATRVARCVMVKPFCPQTFFGGTCRQWLG